MSGASDLEENMQVTNFFIPTYIMGIIWFHVKWYLYFNGYKDTIRNFDDMSNAFPWRSQVSFVPQANFISLH